RDAASGRLVICAPLTSRFPPLTRKRAMTAARYGPTSPTGEYLVVDHNFSYPPPPLPGGRASHSADFRECRRGQKYDGALKALTSGFPCGNYRRFTAVFGRTYGGPGAERARAVLPCRPAAAREAQPEAVRRPEGRRLPLLRAAGRATGPCPQPGRTDLRILF